MATAMPKELHVVSLNCWGLKFISAHRNERLTEIGRQLAKQNPPPDIVGLQECWTQQDYQSIRRETRHILPYGKFYYSGIFGGGLAILSKYPIEESSMVPYRLNGRPTAFWRGDWYVGKGIACARIRLGPGAKDIVEVFTTHLHAPYEREPNDSYICHRTAQAWEIAKIIRGAADRGHLCLALGDFNMIPLSLAHRLLEAHAPVRDVWRVLHPDSSVGAAIDSAEKVRGRPIPTAQFNVTENGVTCDSVYNTWRWNKPQQKLLGPGQPEIVIPDDKSDPEGKRLDYIFASEGLRAHEPGCWVVKSAKVGMKSRHPTLQCSLSDHFSVETTLVWDASSHKSQKKTVEVLAAESEAFVGTPTLQSETEPIEFGKQLTTPSSVNYLPVAVYDEILAMISVYTTRERTQRRWRLYHFIGSVFLSIGCLSAIWWSPRPFVSFLLMLLSTLNFGGGIIDGLIGGLFMGNEIRALKEFEWEIRNARRAAGGLTDGVEAEEEGLKEW
jgi:sphingomyelin phosphodiesterase 2